MFGWGTKPSKPFDDAKDLLRQAVVARNSGEYEVSLQLYQSSLTILLNLVKSSDASDPNKSEYLRLAQTNMNDAEEVKRLKEAQKQRAMQDESIVEALQTPTVSLAKDTPNTVFTSLPTEPTVAKSSSTTTPVRQTSPRPTTAFSSASKASFSTSSATKKKIVLPDHHDYSNRSAAARPTSQRATTGAKTAPNNTGTPASPRPVSNSSTKSADSNNNNNNSSKGKSAATATTSGGGAAQSEYAQQILDELMDQSPGVGWDDIAGLSFAKQTLQEAVILPNLRPDLFTGLRQPPKGVLLFGPPGTGKTLLAKAVATESGFAFFSISAASVTSKYLGEGEKLMRALFEVARAKQPSVIFFDEIDALMSARKDNEHEASRRMKTEFMTQLDGATSNSNDRILIMGATNLPWDLDEAVLRRLVKRIYVPLPDNEARLSLIRHLLNKQGAAGQHITTAQLNAIVSLTEGYSGSDLAAVCQEAALGPIREIALDRLKTVKAEDVRAIQQQDFGQALRIIRPSVSPDSLEQFRKWSDQFGVSSR